MPAGSSLPAGESGRIEPVVHSLLVDECEGAVYVASREKGQVRAGGREGRHGAGLVWSWWAGVTGQSPLVQQTGAQLGPFQPCVTPQAPQAWFNVMRDGRREAGCPCRRQKQAVHGIAGDARARACACRTAAPALCCTTMCPLPPHLHSLCIPVSYLHAPPPPAGACPGAVQPQAEDRL